jgi:hypothetical protein
MLQPPLYIQDKNFTGGINRDGQIKDHAPNEYYDAQDIQHIVNAINGNASIMPDAGNVLAGTLPLISAQPQITQLVLTYNITNINFEVFLDGVSVFSGFVQSNAASGAAWGAAIATDFNTIFGPDITVAFVTSVGSTHYFSMTATVNGINYDTVFEQLEGEARDAIIVQEGYATGMGTGRLKVFAARQVLNDLFIFSSKDNTAVPVYNAVGEIGVIRKDPNTGAWTSYVRLARSRNFRFDTSNTFQVDGKGVEGGKISLYFVDGTSDLSNVPRVFYVTHKTTFSDYTTDQCMKRTAANQTADDPDGFYYYNSLSDSIRLQQQENNAVIEYVDTTSGGVLTTGGKRYSVRFKVGGVAVTPFCQLSGLVPIPAVLEPSVSTQGGNGEASGYKVELQVSNCDSELYDTLELAVVEYNDGAVSGTIIGEYDVTGGIVSVTHTGTESGTSELDLSELQEILVEFAGAKNVVLHDNRLFLSNIEEEVDIDIQNWVQTIAITEVTTDVTCITTPVVGAGNFTNYTFSADQEYYIGSNNYNLLGYYPGETYRFGIRFHLKSGRITRTYWITDFTFSLTNVAANDNAAGTPTVVKVKGIQAVIDYNSVLAPADFVAQVEGHSYVRAKCIPEMLGNGLAFASFGNPEVGYYAAGYPLNARAVQVANVSTLSAFVCPEIIYTNSITPTAGDQILNYGVPYIYNTYTATAAGDDVTYTEINGVADTTAQTLTVENGEYVPAYSRGSKVIGLGLKFSSAIYAGAGTFAGISCASVALKTDVALTEKTANTNYWYYWAFYKRPITDKYGDIDNTQYISMNHYKAVDAYTTSYTETIYGGDTFVQRHFLKLCVRSIDGGGNDDKLGISYYAYSRVNTQMRRLTDPSGLTFPLNTTDLSLWIDADETPGEDYGYDIGYSAESAIAQEFAPYDALLADEAVKPTRMHYSQACPSNSVRDLNRNFAPLDYKDYPESMGQINDVVSVSDSLIVMQPDAIYRQLVNNTAVISTSDSLPTSLGSGGVISTKEILLTNYGLTLKGGSLKYLSESRGGTSVIWVNVKFKKILRWSADGVRPLSDENKFRSFLFNNLQYAITDNDIVMGYDAKRGEVNITVKGDYVASYENYWWTYIFNEYMNAFSTRRSYEPNYYLMYDNTMLSPDYSTSALDTSVPTNQIYEHTITQPVSAVPVIYDGRVASIAPDPWVFTFCNLFPDEYKRFMAVWMDTASTSESIEYYIYNAANAISTVQSTSTSFVEKRPGFFTTLIPNDASDGRLRSMYLGLKIFLRANTGIVNPWQVIRSIAVKFLMKSRRKRS